MEENNFDDIAKRELERAEREIDEMDRVLKESEAEINSLQKDINTNAVENYFEERSAKKSTVWMAVILAIVVISSYFSLALIRPAAKYKEALAMFEKGNYDAAKTKFTSLKDFRNSKEMVKECDYKKGNLLLEKQRYNAAITAFSHIKGYKNRDRIVADLAGTAVTTIATGEKHSAFVRSVGTVKAVGDNSANQCEVTEWKNIEEIACGKDYTIGRDAEGRVFATNASVDWSGIKRIAAADGFFAGLDVNGRVHIYGSKMAGGLTGVKDIAAAGGILACLMEDGSVRGIGADLSSWRNVKEIAVGDNAVYGLKKDGTVISTNGALQECRKIKHIFAAGDAAAAIDMRNNIFTEGSLSPEELKGMLMLAGYKDHRLVMKDDGKVEFIGKSSNGSGNVGDWVDILFKTKE